MCELMVEIVELPDATVVTVSGELDTISAPGFAGDLPAATTRGDVVLDLRAVGFLDAAGLRALVDLQTRLEQADGRLVLAAVPHSVQRIIDIAGLDHLFTTAHTVDAAVALLGRRHRPSTTTGHSHEPGQASRPQVLSLEGLP